jgi:DNA-binding winged helix-turn-helix (wHTH) protein
LREDVASVAIDPSSAPGFRVGSALVNPVAHEATFNGSTERIQRQNLKVLIALAEKRESVVTRGELIARCWDNRVIGDDVIHRAISTLRQFAARAGGFTIETVPKTGYRLTESARRGRKWTSIVGGALLVLSCAAALLAMKRYDTPPSANKASDNLMHVRRNALRAMDLTAIERMLSEGWDPNAPLDENRDGALAILLDNCEWDRSGDQHKILVVARILVDNGARVDIRNSFGDTPYSIAKAKRFCGPDHPVTKLFRMMCTQGPKPLGGRCLASYELDAGGI